MGVLNVINLLFSLLFACFYVVSMQDLEAPTFNRSCTSSDDCLGSEMCMFDFCNQSKCACNIDHFYNGQSCELKKRFEDEECEYCNQCSTWLSVCDTTRDKPVCTCRQGHFYDEATDSCTNIEICPKDETFIFSREDNVCYSVNLTCTDCTNWQDACTENDSIPLHFVGNMREHFINRLWSFGFYSYTNASEANLNDEEAVIVLSNTFDFTSPTDVTPVWYWPNGDKLDLDIDDSEWSVSSYNTTDTGCLYMRYDGCQSVFKASRQCTFKKSYRGCLIQLPNAYCYEDVDERNTTWEYTEGGSILTKSCPIGYAGTVTRECTRSGEFKKPYYNCTLALLKDVTDLLENGNVSAQDALAQVSSKVTQVEDLYIGDLLQVQNILEKVVDLSENVTISENSTNDFLETASFILDHEKNGKEWESRVENEDKGAEGILTSVENFAQRVAESLVRSSTSSLTVAKPNIVLQYAAVDTNKTDSEGISFPTNLQDSPEWNDTTTSSLYLNLASFLDQGVEAFTCLLYRNLSKSVPRTLQGQSDTTRIEINSQVVSFQLLPEAPKILDPELELEFQGFKDTSSSEQHCAYWTTDVFGNGFWSTDGCRKVSGNSKVVKCKCNHLTNFAMLISPYRPSERDENILGIMSIVGCSISGLFILITLVVHLAYWRLMKSDKTILVVCLCVAFIVSYILFLGGVTQTSNETACTAVAVALHYVFLVLFFLMLAEGITVFITVTFPFHKKSHLIELLIAAFVIPLVITGTTAGVSKLEGYGNKNNCWLKPDTWLFWTFAGPACAVILANYITIGLFFRRLFGTKASHVKTLKEKAKMTAVAIGVLTPVMGLTWVFGIFSVNEETIWLQYVFCVLTSFQGILIFLFHCVGNKQLRKVMKINKERKRTMEEFSSELKEKIKHRFGHLNTTSDESNLSTTRDNCSTDGKDGVVNDNESRQAKDEPHYPTLETGRNGSITVENSNNPELVENMKQEVADQLNDPTADSNFLTANAALDTNDTKCNQEARETVSPHLEDAGDDDDITRIQEDQPIGCINPNFDTNSSLKEDKKVKFNESSTDQQSASADITSTKCNQEARETVSPHLKDAGDDDNITRIQEDQLTESADYDNSIDKRDTTKSDADVVKEAELARKPNDNGQDIMRSDLDNAESDINGVDQTAISRNSKSQDMMRNKCENTESETDDVNRAEL
ncbi:adhesion G protein-coupled receptor E1-like [Mercenaria mercenaria]|uniref:adhesion G protein-coupled receptor E1-like n=1 Tax=Mercenaria mercenaria TaxID=6596 RepID=UPI00234FA7E6|nr:adhesion G protein-coupled receptor E1-like [Mercenaria mercenaria]